MTRITVSVFGYTMGHPIDTREYISKIAKKYRVDPDTLRERIEKAQLSLGEIKFIWNCSQ